MDMVEDVGYVVNAAALKILQDVVVSHDTLSDAQLGKVLRTVLQKTEEEAKRQEEEEAKRLKEEWKQGMHRLACHEKLHVGLVNRWYGTNHEFLFQEYLIEDAEDENNCK